MPAPRIAITGPERGGNTAWLFTSALVRWAGGAPIRVRPPDSGLPPGTRGIIIGGGADVGDLPGDQQPVIDTPDGPQEVDNPDGDPDRDQLEAKILADAEERSLPVLGICRGAQLMNHFHGGELFRDLAEFYVEVRNPWTVFPRKQVELTVDADMRGWLPSARFKVNSMHRHAIKTVGQGLRIAALDRARVVQAIEHASQPFWVGVQWHPEYMPQSGVQRALFKALLDHARKRDER